ncbi:MAG: polyprenyl synthetase family protein [Chloroflexaceae bacterium]|nr:polyprenyl synthetase family protein [Chloroflexaceae bacterium]NJL32703.1 polyprenyl synthetase family protein [Chloroflexaceae bacterium]NJO04982.1 polyprenyl synthetase family protein [Chloroflexaceae bacterium]
MSIYETQASTDADHAASAEPSTTVQSLSTSTRERFARAGIVGELQALEDLLLARTASHSAYIAAAGAHTVQAGGKRLRAALALLASRLRGTSHTEQALHTAASVELIHAASLVHDDLVDHTRRRRGRVTVHALWDNDVALMVGDYFFALAAAEMALCRDPRIITYYAQAVQTIVEGELNPVTTVEPLDSALQQYLYKTGAKTATLFAAGCKAGMATGGGSEDDIAALGHYGYDLGVAFQIVDDVLDFIGDEKTLGKPAGNDLREGTITLPLMYAVEQSRSDFLRDIAGVSGLSDEQVAQAIAEVKQAGAIERTQQEARAYVERAVAHLNHFAESPARQTMIELAWFVIQRQT